MAKKWNEYMQALRDDYERMPKTVLAAIAVSFAYRITASESNADALALIREEWDILHRNGIVPQRRAGAANVGLRLRNEAARYGQQAKYWLFQAPALKAEDREKQIEYGVGLVRQAAHAGRLALESR